MTNVQTEMNATSEADKAEIQLLDLVDDRVAGAKNTLAEELLAKTIADLEEERGRIARLECCSERGLNDIRRYVDEIANNARALSTTLDWIEGNAI